MPWHDFPALAQSQQTQPVLFQLARAGAKTVMAVDHYLRVSYPSLCDSGPRPAVSTNLERSQFTLG